MTGDATTPVDVVILTWNDPAGMLESAVASALGSDGVVVRVYVVDNGSDDPVGPFADARVSVHRESANRGVASGRNIGVGLGTSDLVCLLDSDAVLAPHTLARLAEQFADERVGLAVPVFVGQSPEQSAGRAPTLGIKVQRWLGRRSSYQPGSSGAAAPSEAGPSGQETWEVDFGIGACQMFPRTVFTEVGGLDGSIFYGPEDVDFCLRVGTAGYRVVQVSGTDVDHPPRRAFRRPLDRRTVRHAVAVCRHLWRHRRR